MTWYAHATVATVIEKEDRFLMVVENINDRLVINQPAGHLEENESLIEAAVRETLEETGWHVQPTGVLGISRYLAPSNGVTYLRVSFIARALEQQPDAQLDDGIVEARWLSIEELRAPNTLLRSPLVLRDIEKYREGLCFPLSLVYDPIDTE